MEESIATSKELCTSCEDATELLDNLLLYERLEKNTILLALKQESILNFLYSTLKPVERDMDLVEASIHVCRNNKYNISDLHLFTINVEDKILCNLIRKVFKRCIKNAKMNDIIKIDIELIHSIIESPHFRRESMIVFGASRRIIPTHKSYRYLRLHMTVVEPLTLNEIEFLSCNSMDFRREAHNGGGGGFRLVAWLLKEITYLHGGHTGATSTEIFIDLPIIMNTHTHTHSTIPPSPLSPPQTPVQTPQEHIQKVRDLFKQMTPTSNHISIASSPVALSSGLNKGLSVLVVDDSKPSRKILSRVLMSHGYTTTEAEDGQVGIVIYSCIIYYLYNIIYLIFINCLFINVCMFDRLG